MTAGLLSMPMFPLGSVLFPSLALPLHVFEPRYRAMTKHLLTEGVEPEFGVVLIDRGSEVGGDDVRRDVGTVARLREAAELPDGRWALLAVGVRRVHVVEWLPDDPWPRAVVEDLREVAPDDESATADRWAAVLPALRRVLGLAAELGEAAVAATIELSEDPALGSFQAAAVAPLGPADQYRLLAATGVDERLALLSALLDEQAELLEARLRMG
jgi:Lon protease-like protein